MHGLGEFHFIRLTAEFISKRRDTPELVVFLKISAASSPGRKLLFVCRTIAAAWSPITSTRKVAISSWVGVSAVPALELNPVEYLWARIGSSMRCPTSVQGTLWSTLLIAASWKHA
jgi:hypothetical protein